MKKKTGNIKLEFDKELENSAIETLFPEKLDNANKFLTNAKKPSDFLGTVSLEEGEKFQEYINQSRNDWERDAR